MKHLVFVCLASLFLGCGRSDSFDNEFGRIADGSASAVVDGGLQIMSAPTPLSPPNEDPSVLAHHTRDDTGGNTSLRFVEGRRIDENKYPVDGVTVFAKADRRQPQRDRDLGQTFLTGDKRVKLDALFLRIGHADLAVLENAPAARVAVQWFEVAGHPKLNDHGTPGFAGHFDRAMSPELDDYLEGETYTPLRTVEGRLPDKLNGGDYLKFDFRGDDELVFEPRRTYAFLLMFLDRKANRGMTLANEYYGAYMPDPANKLCGHGIRREGLPAFADDWTARLTQSPGTLGFPDVCTFRDLYFAVTVTSVIEPTRSYTPPPPVNFRDPPRDYVEHQSDSRTIFLEKELSEQNPQQAERVVQRLNAKVDQVLGLFPVHSRERLGQLSFFILLGSKAKAGGRDSGAEYFRRIDPDYHLHLDPRWRNAIVIYSAANYLWQNEYWATQMLVHEFAHAWHLEQWPEQQPEMVLAWERAKAAGLYCRIKDVNGTILETAYAIHNQLEYFAELSCVYFWRGEYEPFDRSGLHQYDPGGFAMIEKMWGIHEPPPPVSERAGKHDFN